MCSKVKPMYPLAVSSPLTFFYALLHQLINLKVSKNACIISFNQKNLFPI